MNGTENINSCQQLNQSQNCAEYTFNESGIIECSMCITGYILDKWGRCNAQMECAPVGELNERLVLGTWCGCPDNANLKLADDLKSGTCVATCAENTYYCDAGVFSVCTSSDITTEDIEAINSCTLLNTIATCTVFKNPSFCTKCGGTLFAMADGTCASSIGACESRDVANNSLIANQWCYCVSSEVALKVGDDLTKGTCADSCEAGKY